MLWLVGLVYFFLVMIPGVIALALMALPVLQEWLDRAVLVIGNEPVLVPRILYPLSVIAGFLILTVLLHLVRAVGGAHARLAKMLLVGEGTAP